MDRIVIVGCGYTGCRLAARCVAAGHAVEGLVRSPEAAARVVATGAAVRSWDLDRSPDAGAPDVSGAQVFYFTPPPDRGADDPRLARFLALCEARGLPRRVVYASTSGVYGDCAGEWVDEERPLAPATPRARRRAAAEACLHEWSGRTGCEVVVLRIAGIYGPGRLPIERLRRALPVVRPEESGYSNRIHVDDLVTVASAASVCGRSGRAYNVADGEPSSMADYFNQVADAVGLPRPPQITFAEALEQMPPALLSFLQESRRLVVRRMREELGVTLRFPDLVSGLANC